MQKDTTVQNIPTVKIKFGVRRREDYGDMDGLVASIERDGLIHPITLDRDYNLVCGGRRLRAFERLGYKEIPATVRGRMTEESRRILELEENRQRKDFTQHEDALTLVQLAAKAAEELRFELSRTVPEKSAHRPKKADSVDAVVARLRKKGVSTSRRSLSRAEKRVEAVEADPTLIGASQRQATGEKGAYQFTGEDYGMMDELISRGLHPHRTSVLQAGLVLLYAKEESKPTPTRMFSSRAERKPLLRPSERRG